MLKNEKYFMGGRWGSKMTRRYVTVAQTVQFTQLLNWALLETAPFAFSPNNSIFQMKSVAR
jgi:hypothetical protein